MRHRARGNNLVTRQTNRRLRLSTQPLTTCTHALSAAANPSVNISVFRPASLHSMTSFLSLITYHAGFLGVQGALHALTRMRNRPGHHSSLSIQPILDTCIELTRWLLSHRCQFWYPSRGLNIIHGSPFICLVVAIGSVPLLTYHPASGCRRCESYPWFLSFFLSYHNHLRLFRPPPSTIHP